MLRRSDSIRERFGHRGVSSTVPGAPLPPLPLQDERAGVFGASADELRALMEVGALADCSDSNWHGETCFGESTARRQPVSAAASSSPLIAPP